MKVDHKIVEMAGWSWTYPHQLGYDVAGVVKALGSDCTRLKVGDEVWGEAGDFWRIRCGGFFGKAPESRK